MGSRVKKKPRPASSVRRAPQAVTPTKQFGVEVQGSEDGFVQLTLHAGNATIAVVWAVQDALYVSNLIRQAAEGNDKPVPEVVRDTGLIVAGEMP
jgi:hypothetical protein